MLETVWEWANQQLIWSTYLIECLGQALFAVIRSNSCLRATNYEEIFKFYTCDVNNQVIFTLEQVIDIFYYLMILEWSQFGEQILAVGQLMIIHIYLGINMEETNLF